MKPLLPVFGLAALLIAGCEDREARMGLKNRGIESSDAALFKKAKEGDAEVVSLLIRNGRSPNAVEEWSGRSPLMLASEVGHLAVVEALIAARADVNARVVAKEFRSGPTLFGLGGKSSRPTPGWTALMFAAQSGHVDVVRALLRAGAKANVKGDRKTSNNVNDTTPLMLAVGKGYLDISRMLLESGAETDVSDLAGETPLTLATSVEMLQLLQKAGVNLTRKNANGRSALRTAVGRVDEAMIRFLVQAGADPNERDISGRPIIHFALGRASKALVELGADVNAKDAGGQTAIMRWARESRYQNATLNLYRLGAKLDGLTPEQATRLLSDAVAENNIEAANAAIKIVADANAGSRFGGSLLASAAYDGKTEMVRLLLDAGANVKTESEGWTALHGASLMGRKKIVEMLIKAGANVNAVDKHGRTPLNQAVQFKHEDIAQILRDAGAK